MTMVRIRRRKGNAGPGFGEMFQDEDFPAIADWAEKPPAKKRAGPKTSAQPREYIHSNKITKTEFKAEINRNRAFGNLAVLPVEVRNDIWSRLLDDDFKQVYDMESNGTVYANKRHSSGDPPFLRVGPKLRDEMLTALTGDRHCEVRVGEHQVSTNFAMHDNDAQRSQWAELRSHLSIPTCKRINITIDPPSPRSGQSFYRVRQNVQMLIDIINAGERDINCQISAQIDRTNLQCTYSYNDFSMFFGPFSALKSRCKAVMVFRTTGIPALHAKVESYSNLIEAAMIGNAEARVELMLHQSVLDIKLAISSLTIYYNADKPSWLQKRAELDEQAFKTVTVAISRMATWYEAQGMELPMWLGVLRLHVTTSPTPRRIERVLQEVVLQDETVNDMNLWAGGFLSARNPFFDEAGFFRREGGK